MKIYLIGYRCTGKSTTGKLLAEKLGLSLVDTDKVVEERLGDSITEIVSKQGWEFFRKAEKEILEETSKRNNLVIATGGGMVLDKKNRAVMKASGCVIWLKASLQIILERMAEDQSTPGSRPSLTGQNILDETARVLTQRHPLYKETAEIILDTTNFSPWEAVEEILRRIDHGR